jgi:hypothetical protein
VNTVVDVGIEVLTAVDMKSNIFWDVTPCSPLKVNQGFGGTSSPSSVSCFHSGILFGLFFDPKDGGDMFP